MTKQFRLNKQFDVVKDTFGGSQMWFKSRYNVQTGCGFHWGIPHECRDLPVPERFDVTPWRKIAPWHSF